MTKRSETIEVLLREERLYPPSEEFRENAVLNDDGIYAEAAADYLAFWESFAKELHWTKPWGEVLDWKLPFANWFPGGELNVSSNCIDRHLSTPRRNKAAFIWESEGGETKMLTYWELYREVNKFANVLRKLGVQKGDRVTIYMPMIPELPIAMLACARVGAPHSIVFGGFSAESLRDRIHDSESRVLITADGGFRRGKIVPLKANADAALMDDSMVESVVVVRRVGGEAHVTMKGGRDYWWDDLMCEAHHYAEPEPMKSEDALFILYTSGTTGKPKGIVHSTGGYLVGVYATTKCVFDLKEEDTYFCTADIGWITGHSYIVYGPLANGATSVIYEGAPDYPDKDRYWSMVEGHGVTIFYTAPTAIRTFMKWGEEFPRRHDLGTLRLLGTVGEPINPEAWMWYYSEIGADKCPIVDTWWQTETGSILITPLPGVTSLKPGSATLPFPGVEVDVVDEEGNSVGVGAGYLVVKKPWPAMLQTVYGDSDRYFQEYWSRFPGVYFTGDGAKRDEDGYIWVLGRVDDVMNVSGHRVSTMEIESALVDHPDVAESAVIGRSDEVTGQAIVAFVTLRESVRPEDCPEDKLKAHVAEKIGPIARPREIIYTGELPKTRSGKIMRRLLRDIAEGRVIGDTTTLADPTVVNELKAKYEHME